MLALDSLIVVALIGGVTTLIGFIATPVVGWLLSRRTKATEHANSVIDTTYRALSTIKLQREELDRKDALIAELTDEVERLRAGNHDREPPTHRR